MNWTEQEYADHLARLTGRPTKLASCVSGDSEALIEAECTKILEEDGWRALRTDPVSDRGRGKGFGEVGMADHWYVRYNPSPMWVSPGSAEVMWIEFKRPGEKPQKHQIAWHVRERARGALTLIAGEDFPASVEGFAEWYRGSGLCRRISEVA